MRRLKRRRRSERRPVRPRREPEGPPARGGRRWGLEARQEPGARRPGTHRGPRLRPAPGGAPGPASRRRRTSLPSGRPGPRAGLEAAGTRLRVANSGFRSQRRTPLASRPPLRLGARGRLPRGTLAGDRPPHLPPGRQFTCSGSARGASRPGPRRRVRNAATRVRSPFPPPPLRSLARRGAGRRQARRGDARRAPGGETLPLAARPGKSSLAAARRERAGGRPNGEGSRRAGNGCHVAQVDRRPPPPSQPPVPRRDLWFVPGSAKRVGPPPGPAWGTQAPGRARLLRLRWAASRAWRALPRGTRSSSSQKPRRKACLVSPFPWGPEAGGGGGHIEEQAPFSVSGFRGAVWRR